MKVCAVCLSASGRPESYVGLKVSPSWAYGAHLAERSGVFAGLHIGHVMELCDFWTAAGEDNWHKVSGAVIGKLGGSNAALALNLLGRSEVLGADDLFDIDTIQINGSASPHFFRAVTSVNGTALCMICVAELKRVGVYPPYRSWA